MLKFTAITASIMMVASNAYAGSVALLAPVAPEVLEEPAGSMGGSGMWLLPLLAIALIFFAMNRPSQCTSTCI